MKTAVTSPRLVMVWHYTDLDAYLFDWVAIFFRHMANLLSPLLKEGWIKNYLDNLILWGPDFSTLMARLGKIFTLLMENGVKLK